MAGGVSDPVTHTGYGQHFGHVCLLSSSGSGPTNRGLWTVCIWLTSAMCKHYNGVPAIRQATSSACTINTIEYGAFCFSVLFEFCTVKQAKEKFLNKSFGIFSRLFICYSTHGATMRKSITQEYL